MDGALLVGVLEKFIERDPANAAYHYYLGMAHYDQRNWAEAKSAFEESLRLNPRQPEALNNLAWLLLTCPDERFLDADRALELAEGALSLKVAAYILDTLAEAYLANEFYEKAFRAARRALELATDNPSYYRKQLKKMADAYKKLGSGVVI